MLSEKINTLTLNQYAKSIYENQMPYIIYSEIKSLSKKLHGCENNPKNTLTKTAGEHIFCEYSMSIISHLIIKKTNIRYTAENSE